MKDKNLLLKIFVQLLPEVLRMQAKLTSIRSKQPGFRGNDFALFDDALLYWV
jgi:hypothetical protein